jgi:hypothetical protein
LRVERAYCGRLHSSARVTVARDRFGGPAITPSRRRRRDACATQWKAVARFGDVRPAGLGSRAAAG